MTITLYKTVSEVNKLDKMLKQLAVVSGTLRESSSIIDPVFNLSGIDIYVADCNYVYITDFNRYYFVQNVESINNGLWRLTLHVDVLMSYKNEIRNNYAIIERNEKNYDLKLNDGLFVTQQNPRRAQFTFPAGFNTWSYVLAVAGN